MPLKDALKELEEGIEDLTSLHVQTFTGVIEMDMGGDTFKTLKDKVETAKKDGKVLLVAETLMQSDGDSYNFITNVDVPAQAIEMHKNGVKAGMECRQAIIDLFKNLINLK